MTKLKVSLVHLSISIAAISIALVITIELYYPNIFFYLQSSFDAVKILILVDIILGPLITLIIFKPNKKGLKFDLYVIACLQISALAYGLNILYKERPIYLVYSADRFEVITSSDIDLSRLANENLKPSPFSEVKVVNAKLPDDSRLREIILFEALSGGKDVHLRPEHYQEGLPKDKIRKKSLNILAVLQQTANPELKQWVDRHNIEDFYYFPVIGKKKMGLAILEKDSFEISSFLKVNPWSE